MINKTNDLDLRFFKVKQMPTCSECFTILDFTRAVPIQTIILDKKVPKDVLVYGAFCPNNNCGQSIAFIMKKTK